MSRGRSLAVRVACAQLRVRIGAALAYLERYTLAPAGRAVAGPWVAGRARYLATAIVHHDAATSDAAETLQGLAPLKGCPACEPDSARPGPLDVDLGVDLIQSKTIVGRILAADGAPFAAARAAFHGLALHSIFGAAARVGRK